MAFQKKKMVSFTKKEPFSFQKKTQDYGGKKIKANIWSIATSTFAPVPTSRRSRELFHVKLQCLHLQHPRKCPQNPGLVCNFFSKSGLKGGKNPWSLIRKMKQNQLKTKKIHPNIYPTIHPTIYTEVHKLQTYTILQKTSLTEKKFKMQGAFITFAQKMPWFFFHTRKRVISFPRNHVTRTPSPTWVSLGTARQGDTNAVATFLGHNQWCLGGSCPTFLGAESFVKPSPWRS